MKIRFFRFFHEKHIFRIKNFFQKNFFLNKYISIYTCSRPKISRRFRIWSQIRSNLNILGDIAIFWFLLDIKKNAPEKWFVGYFSEVYHPIRGSYTSFCDNVISNNLIPSVLQSVVEWLHVCQKCLAHFKGEAISDYVRLYEPL